MINESDLPGYFVPMRWTWVMVFGVAALLTEWWLLMIITLVVAGIAMWEDFEESDFNSNFGSDREDIDA